MSTENFPCTTENEGIWGKSTVYSVARATATYIQRAYVGTDRFVVGQRYYLSAYDIFRAFLKFNTSSIDTSAAIINVNMGMVCLVNHSDIDFDVEIVQYDWSGEDPLSTDNMDTAYDGCLAASVDAVWRNTSGMALNTQYLSPNLDTSWVVPGGYTYYALRSKRDYDSIATAGFDFIYLASQGHATEAYRPILIVEYVLGAKNFVSYFLD